MTPDEIRKKKDFKEMTQKLRHELVTLKLQARLGTCPDSSKIQKLKKDLARIETIQREEAMKKEAKA